MIFVFNRSIMKKKAFGAITPKALAATNPGPFCQRREWCAVPF
jgi:hypothetical protein